MITLRRLIAEQFKGLVSIDLLFPERGSILVEGHNEAGKSTLFEAIYVALYGEPLVGEESRARQEEVIAHGQEEARVELTVAVGPRELTIRRTFTRNQQQRATLVIRRPGTAVETISRIRAANERLLKELGGLDGDSLRNSCFVEQQELGRLEALSRTEREQAVHKLLGLERLTDLRRRFRYTREQERELQLAQRRCDLALAQAEAARLTGEAATLREQRDAAQVAAHLHQRAGMRHDAGETKRALDACRVDEADARAGLERCKRLQDVLSGCKDADDAVEALRQTGAAHAVTEAALAEIDQLARDEEPALRKRLRQIEAAIDTAVQVEKVVHEATQQTATRAALQEWVRLKGIETRVRAFEQDHAGLEAERAAVAVAQAARERKSRLLGVTAGVGGMAAILAGLGGLTWPPLFALAALFLLAGGVLALRFLAVHRGAARLATAHAACEARMRDFTVANQATMQAGGDLGALAVTEAALRDAGVDVPASVEDVQAQAQARLRLNTEAGGNAGNADSAGSARQVHEQERAAEAEAYARLAALAEEVGVAPERSALEGERGRVEERLQALGRRLATRDGLAEQATLQESAVAGAWTSACQAVAAVVEVFRSLREQGSVEIVTAGADEQEDAEPDADALAALLQRARMEAVALLAALEEAGLQTTLEKALRDAGIHTQRLEGLRAAEDNLGADIRDLLTAHAFAVSDDVTAACVVAGWPLVATVAAGDLMRLTEGLEEAEKRLYAAKERAGALSAELDHDGTVLDLEASAERVALLRDEQAICGQAERAIKEAQEGIARHVLPTTERNMQLLLPQLTAGRYRDVRLTAPESEDGQPGEMDYRIRVWDPMGGRYVAKNLFSGGTRDQCSLALRLAFALATLPQELGVAPGFIILDEPLTAFDAERAQALVALLTTGTIAEQFAQVIVISHGHAFDRSAFAYHVVMEHGRVRRSTLPDNDEMSPSSADGAMAGDEGGVLHPPRGSSAGWPAQGQLALEPRQVARAFPAARSPSD